MAKDSKIEWTTHTFNPWIGCTKVSEGCKFCYAENLMDTRWNKVKWGPLGERKLTSESNWRQPYAWDKAAAKSGQRARVFCASLADVFEDNPQLIEIRRDLMVLIERTRNLDWLLLTKRPQNANRLIEQATGRHAHAWLADCGHVWVGTSVEDQDAADTRIPELLQVPAAIRFLSCEPLLGPVDLTCVDDKVGLDVEGYLELDVLRGFSYDAGYGEYGGRTPAVHWVIVGGESGPNARPMDSQWAWDLLDQCKRAGVPFFMKQLGSVLAQQHGLRGKGDELDQLPADLRVREFPTEQAALAAGGQAG